MLEAEKEEERRNAQKRIPDLQKKKEEPWKAKNK